MPQTVDSGGSNSCCAPLPTDINDNKHISSHNKNKTSPSAHASAGKSGGGKPGRHTRKKPAPMEHIYENLRPTTEQRLMRKYFCSDVIYENLCRGCGYGVFAAQGRYCHFCQCIASGVLAVSQEPATPSMASECNIYENICEQCRGIYSDQEACLCTTTSTQLDKSQTMLKHSKTLKPETEPAASGTLTRRGLFHGLFGSLKQLNRTASSASLQRRRLRLFQREPHKSAAAAGGSLEIIHNVDEVFRTQETFDMQRICELKRSQTSRSEQHIYGRLKCQGSSSEQLEQKETPATPPPNSTQPTVGKKPRVSKIRLLRGHSNKEVEAATTPTKTVNTEALPSLYLNESICLWMSLLRQELHSYEDANSAALCQQPKSVPSTYEQQRQQQQAALVSTAELLIMRREQAEHTPEQQLVRDFKRQLLARIKQCGPEETVEQQQQPNNDNLYKNCQLPSSASPESAAELVTLRRELLEITPQQQLEQIRPHVLEEAAKEQQPEHVAHTDRRRCGINERNDSAFVSEFLSAFECSMQHSSAQQLERQQSANFYQIVALPTSAALPAKISLFKLLNSAALAASLHLSVIGYDKSLSAFLHAMRRRRWLRQYRRRCRCSFEESPSESVAQQRPLLGPVLPAQPKSDDVVCACRVASYKLRERHEANTVKTKTPTKTEQAKTKTKSLAGSETETVAERERLIDISSGAGSAVMASAPKQPTVLLCEDSENSNNNNNNNNININNNNNNNGIRVKRRAPQVPQRDPSTALSTRTTNSTPIATTTSTSAVTKSVSALESAHARATSHESNNNIAVAEKEMPKMLSDDDDACMESEEESIYQPIWQFKTVGEAQEHYEAPLQELNDEEDDDDNEELPEEDYHLKLANEQQHGVDSDDAYDEDEDEYESSTAALQAAAAFAAGARQKSSKHTVATSPLPSPTASTDQGAWETDDEFMFATQRQAEVEPAPLPQQQQQISADTLSLGSTVTNSTATLGSLSSRGSGSGSISSALTHISLMHPVLRNVCIFYSVSDPKKYSAIFYEYQRAHIHEHFMTRVRRPAPPPPLPERTPKQLTATNDDSGCSCEAASLEEEPQQQQVAGESASIESIPQPIREAWAMAVLAATTTKRSGPVRGGRKLRVRSNALLLTPESVLAWRELLQHVNYCEDEEDMIVPVTDILRAQQIKEDNEVQQTQQTTILQRFKSASIGNLVDLPGEDDKKSIKNRMRMKLNSNVFRINRSPKSEKKSRARRGQVNSLYLDEQSKYPLFGVPLNALELNMTNHPNVPRFVVDVCAYIERQECIEQDGLYRASGNKLLIDELKKKLTHLYEPRWLQTDDIHTLTSLHKQFFRELAAPLITQQAYERLGRNLTDDAAIERMRTAFDEMPEPNRSTLRFLIKHLTNVAAASASNRMPASNLAIVWGPCLLAANQIQFDIGRMNMLAKVLIENYERIFRPDNERLVC